MRPAIFWAAYSGNSLPRFWDNLSVPSSGINFSVLEEMHNNCGKAMHTGTKNRGFTVLLVLPTGEQPTECQNVTVHLKVPDIYLFYVFGSNN